MWARILITAAIVNLVSSLASAQPSGSPPPVEAGEPRWSTQIVMRPFTRVVNAPIPGSSTEGRTSATGLGYGGSRRVYLYEATFRNRSPRSVKAIRWDHLFLDPKSDTVLRRFAFRETRSKIGKNGSKTFRRYSPRPPSGTIDAENRSSDLGEDYKQRIDIKCVLFSDGTIWKAADATSAQCASILQRDR